MDRIKLAFVDELTSQLGTEKVAASFHQGSTVQNPREMRQSLIRRILNMFGAGGESLEYRNMPRRRRRKRR